MSALIFGHPHSGTCITYTILRVTIDENLSAPCAANKRCNLGELPTGTLLLDLQRLVRDLVAIQPRGVLPAPQYQGRVRLLRAHDLLLDVLVDGRLNGTHETRAHIDAAGSEAQCRSEPLSVGEAAGGDEGGLEGLSCTREKDEVGDVRFADMAEKLLVNIEDIVATARGKQRMWVCVRRGRLRRQWPCA